MNDAHLYHFPTDREYHFASLSNVVVRCQALFRIAPLRFVEWLYVISARFLVDFLLLWLTKFRLYRFWEEILNFDHLSRSGNGKVDVIIFERIFGGYEMHEWVFTWRARCFLFGSFVRYYFFVVLNLCGRLLAPRLSCEVTSFARICFSFMLISDCVLPLVCSFLQSLATLPNAS